MPRFQKRNLLVLAAGFAAVYLALRYLLPLAMPFLLGILIAIASEPAVGLLSRRMGRGVAAVLGVTVTLLLLGCVLLLLSAVAVRELGLLLRVLPDLEQTARSGLNALEGMLLGLAQRLPEGIAAMLTGSVTGLFSNGNAIMDRLVRQLPSLASSVLGRIPGSALAMGTGILSGFMISARLPALRQWLKEKWQEGPLSRLLPVVRQVRKALSGWLKAQLKLAGLCFLIVCGGLLLLRIPYAPIWAALIALVDAIPVLGTGTVLLPWALVCLVQGESVRALGLVGIYVSAVVSRSVLEPRLVGKQLGLDPLLTLAALYTGFRIWGIGGMLISPMICVAALELSRART